MDTDNDGRLSLQEYIMDIFTPAHGEILIREKYGTFLVLAIFRGRRATLGGTGERIV